MGLKLILVVEKNRLNCPSIDIFRCFLVKIKGHFNKDTSEIITYIHYLRSNQCTIPDILFSQMFYWVMRLEFCPCLFCLPWRLQPIKNFLTATRLSFSLVIHSKVHKWIHTSLSFPFIVLKGAQNAFPHSKS